MRVQGIQAQLTEAQVQLTEAQVQLTEVPAQLTEVRDLLQPAPLLPEAAHKEEMM